MSKRQGMDYLESLPRRWVTVYLPLGCFVFVLLFPFYWMVMTSFNPNEELVSRAANPFWIVQPTLAHFERLLFKTAYPQWMWNTMLVAVVSTFASLAAIVFQHHWGALTAGALPGSLPVAIMYSFFVEHYVSGMTGAVQE